MAEERCVCCGEIIPEGWQTCLRCRSKLQEEKMKGEQRQKFICPACGRSVCTTVEFSRMKYNAYVRYRKCENCGAVMVTEERIDHLSRGRRKE